MRIAYNGAMTTVRWSDGTLYFQVYYSWSSGIICCTVSSTVPSHRPWLRFSNECSTVYNMALTNTSPNQGKMSSIHSIAPSSSYAIQRYSVNCKSQNKGQVAKLNTRWSFWIVYNTCLKPKPWFLNNNIPLLILKRQLRTDRIPSRIPEDTGAVFCSKYSPVLSSHRQSLNPWRD